MPATGTGNRLTQHTVPFYLWVKNESGMTDAQQCVCYKFIKEIEKLFKKAHFVTEFGQMFVKRQVDLPPEFQQAIDDHFWELIDEVETDS